MDPSNVQIETRTKRVMLGRCSICIDIHVMYDYCNSCIKIVYLRILFAYFCVCFSGFIIVAKTFIDVKALFKAGNRVEKKFHQSNYMQTSK